MLVAFRTEKHAEITMFGDIAKQMLKKMGHSVTIPGAILAEDVAAALERLANSVEGESGADQDADKGAWDDQGVSLKNRALPLIGLLKAAAEQKTNVMWDLAGATEPGLKIS